MAVNEKDAYQTEPASSLICPLVLFVLGKACFLTLGLSYVSNIVIALFLASVLEVSYVLEIILVILSACLSNCPIKKNCFSFEKTVLLSLKDLDTQKMIKRLCHRKVNKDTDVNSVDSDQTAV